MKKLLLLVMLLLPFAEVHSQNLPKVQQQTLRAPQSVKIDGIINEWGDKFLAYNPATEVFYTMANDSENLYIAASVSGGDNINRVVSGGLAFVVSRTGQKKDADQMVFTFPTYDAPGGKGDQRFNTFRPGMNEEFRTRISEQNSSMLKNSVKFIRTAGVKDVDTLLSIYNTFNIQAACAFDADGKLNLEIAIPLKYMREFVNAGKLHYRMVVNGTKVRIAKTMTVVFADGHQATEEDINKAMAHHIDREGRLAAPTEFSGEYLLAN